MATLEKIRSKGTLLLIVVGLALFAFIIGDFLNSGSTYFGQSKQNVITVGDEVVKIGEYQSKIDELTMIYNPSKSSDEYMTEQIRQYAFDNMVQEKLIKDATLKVGIAVSPKELGDLILGENPSPFMRSFPLFVDQQTGAFNRDLFLSFYNYSQKTPESAEEAQQIAQYQKIENYIENSVQNNKLQDKYTTLLVQALNTNSLDAKFTFENKLTTVDALYVLKPYSAIADSTITVSDKDIEKEYAIKKEQFKQEASRNIDYVTFAIKPSTEDYEKIADWINRLKEEFRTSDDVMDLVNSSSDVAYPAFSSSEKDMDPDFKTFAFSGKKDSIDGPILSNDVYKMAKIIESSVAPDSANIRHILLFEKDDTTTQTLADSIVNALKGGADFATLVTKYSKNPGTAQNGGEVGWVKEANVEKEMVKPIFYESGNIFAVKTNNGTHVVEVTSRTAKVNKVKLAILSRGVNASPSTYSKIYNEAKDFVAKNNTVELFEAGAKESGFVLHPAQNVGQNATRLNNITDSRKIVRWAFESDSKVVSDVFECGDDFIVAAVTTINKEGYKPVTEVTEQLKAVVILDKKAEIIMKQFDTELKQNNTIEKLASANSLEVDTLKGINFSMSRTAIGFEPAIVAIAPYMKENALSAPIKGKNGVYVINPYSVAVSENSFDEAQEKNQQSAMYRYMIPQSMMNVLREKGNVVDKRYNFY